MRRSNCEGPSSVLGLHPLKKAEEKIENAPDWKTNQDCVDNALSTFDRLFFNSIIIHILVSSVSTSKKWRKVIAFFSIRNERGKLRTF